MVEREGFPTPITSVVEACSEFSYALRIVDLLQNGGLDEKAKQIEELRERLNRIDEYLRSVASYMRFEQSMRKGSHNENGEGVGGIVLREGLEIDFRGLRIVRDGEEFNLTPREHTVIKVLAENAGRAVPRMEIEEALYGEDCFKAGHPGTVPVFVHHLRKKLGEDADNPRFLVTRAGCYMLDVSPRDGNGTEPA